MSAAALPLPIKQADSSSVPARQSISQRSYLLSRTESLALWQKVTLQSVLQDGPDFTTRQLAILMTVYLESGPHTVRSLASQLNVTKAVITRAINCLEKLKYVQRAPDQRDKRSVIIVRTSLGMQYLLRFSELIQKELPNSLKGVPRL